MPEAPQRKLAAIMFTDIAGYTALMGEDESKALQLLKQNREILKPIIRQFHGEWLKEIGDGTLSSFASAVDAVNCALEIQYILRHDPDLILRIGIHIGDVVFEEGDVFGDGVNVASRIEPLAEPGGICISGRVYDDIRNKPDIETVFLGEKRLKGVDRLVKIYALSGVGLPTPLAKVPAGKRVESKGRTLNVRRLVPVLFGALIVLGYFAWDWSRSRDPLSAFEHSVVVMPFDNLTGDPDNDVWEKGVASLIIDELTVYRELYVLDSQTLFEILNTLEQTRKAQVLPSLAREVADRTRIRTLLLGDILKAGSTLLLQARLMDARTGQVTFSHQVAGESEDDLPVMAKSLAERVRNHLEIGIIEKEVDIDIRAPRVRSPRAYRLYVQGTEDFHMSRWSPAVEALRQAVALDSLLGPAYYHLLAAYVNAGMVDSARALFDRTYPHKGQFTRVWEQLWDLWRAYLAKDIRETIRVQEQILARNPLNRALWYQLGWTYNCYNKPEKAIAPLEKAWELSDRWGGWKWVWLYFDLGYAYHETGQHRKELKVYKRGLEVLPEHPDILYRLAVCYLSRGDTARAAPYLERYKQKREEEGRSEAHILNGLGSIYRDAGHLDHAQVYYRQAMGIDPQYHWPYGNLGGLLIDNDLDVEEGLGLLETALDLSPENPYHLHTKGWGLYKQGRYAEALEVLERAWELRAFYDHEHYQHLQAARKAARRGK